MDQRYLRPPEGFSIEGYMAFLRYVLAVIMALGGIVTVAALIYLAIHFIKAIYGVSQLRSKDIKVAVWGLVIGILLLGGGWIGWLKFFHKALYPTNIL